MVVFAHGRGGSRRSPRTRAAAEVVRRARLGRLLVDLLTVEKERLDAEPTTTLGQRFGLPPLERRLVGLVDAVGQMTVVKGSAGRGRPAVPAPCRIPLVPAP
ncbi:hypothetical protein [Streptomyces sp. WMMC1477]|uniref:hypothetical protein n=1 Tax=Streptomyces sp. WMMC1477 TaxID=3015155 RepID=UPI0022B67207|nr:hypothetical protein [Streptomyces sp. WMMC1477]MCZ7433340.1 hypothetical protein [Streptomyces sp. WMMC1477]